MWFLVLCLVVLAAASSAGYAAHYFLRRFGAAAAWGGAITAFLAGIGLFPLPIHGGMTVVGAAIFHDFKSELRQLRGKGDAVRDEIFLQSYAGRFKAPLDPGRAAGLGAVHDADSGLLWGGPFEFGGEGLEDAKKLCARLDPAGYWALPGEGEYYRYWKSFGKDLRRERPGRYLSFLVEESLHAEMPTTVLSRGPGPGGQASSSPSPRVYCVARTAAAPERGYLNGDIPLEEWNLYQLDKMR